MKFQFPTGWNSTGKADGENEPWWGVSIPNGMEFYLSAIEAAFRKERVSIPNEMEFYHSVRFS